MSAVLVPAISIVVGLYGLAAIILRFIQFSPWTPAPASTTALGPFIFPSLLIALGFIVESALLYGIHVRPRRPHFGTALSISTLLVLLAIGLVLMSGYTIVPGQGNWLRPAAAFASHRIFIVPIIVLMGFLSFSRRIGPWALMGGGAVTFVLSLFYYFSTPSAMASPPLGALIGIGFIIAGNRQYQDWSSPVY